MREPLKMPLFGKKDKTKKEEALVASSVPIAASPATQRRAPTVEDKYIMKDVLGT